MLALKDMRISTPQPRLSLLDLPNEILDSIIQDIYLDSGRFQRSITSTSLTCWRLRKSTYAALFGTITLITKAGVPDLESLRLLANFASSYDDRAKHVRNLQILTSISGYHDPVGSSRSISIHPTICQELSNTFKRLGSIKTVSLDLENFAVLEILCDSICWQPLNINITSWSLKKSDWLVNKGYMSFIQRLKDDSTTCRFSLATFPWGRQHLFQLDDRKLVHLVSSLHWTTSNAPKNLNHDLRIIGSMNNLEELSLTPGLGVVPSDLSALSLTISQLQSLRRLSVSGETYAGAILKVVHQLKNLESLRLHSDVERLFHAHLHSEEREGLPYLTLPRLHTLEIRYISRYLSIEHILPSSLRCLRLEYHERTDRLRPFDFRWMARRLPYLECLEVNIGVLRNLWAPTAIAGVDVDVEVYQLLEALASFKNLRRLRFFPSYWKSQGGFLNFVQPVSDEQAVRVFQYLFRRKPNLQLLIISNTRADYLLKQEIYARDVTEPMKWVVRPCGSKTILTTHQAGDNYELEQVWDGERRLTMTNVPHRYRHLHFDELHGWTAPAPEFPFDLQG